MTVKINGFSDYQDFDPLELENPFEFIENVNSLFILKNLNEFYNEKLKKSPDKIISKYLKERKKNTKERLNNLQEKISTYKIPSTEYSNILNILLEHNIKLSQYFIEKGEIEKSFFVKERINLIKKELKSEN